VRHRANDQAIASEVVIERSHFVTGVAAVDRSSIVTDEMIVIERDGKRAIVVGHAKVNAAGCIHDDRTNPINAQINSHDIQANQETVRLVEREILLHHWKTGAHRRDHDLIAADGRITPTAVTDSFDVSRTQPNATVKAGQLPGIIPVKVRGARIEIIFQPDIAI